MTDKSRVDQLLAPLRRDDASEITDLELDRERVLSHMLRASEKPGPRIFSARWPTGAWAFAAALALALGLAGYHATRSPERVATLQPTTAESTGAVGTLVDDDGLRASGATGPRARAVEPGATVRTSFGATIRLIGGTRISGLEAMGEAGKVELNAGTVRCEVPKLEGGREFQVLTPTARVVVLGTVFEVSVRAMEGRSETTVTVEEGVVAIDHDSATTLVPAGRSWSSDSAERDANPRDAAPGPDPRARGEKRGNRATPSDGETPPVGSSGTLAQETQLFQAALRAERAGDRERANELFRDLLEQFPASPLAPYARQGLSRTQR